MSRSRPPSPSPLPQQGEASPGTAPQPRTYPLIQLTPPRQRRARRPTTPPGDRERDGAPRKGDMKMGVVARGMMLPAVLPPPTAEGGLPRTGLASPSSRPHGENGGVHGGEGVLVPFEGMMEGRTGGFHKCGGEQGFNEKKKEMKHREPPPCPLPSTWESCPSGSPLSLPPHSTLQEPSPPPTPSPHHPQTFNHVGYRESPPLTFVSFSNKSRIALLLPLELEPCRPVPCCPRCPQLSPCLLCSPPYPDPSPVL